MLDWFSQHIGGPTILIFIGAIISAAGALWASVEQTKSEQYLKEKNQEIAELNKQISMSITGGDSFCYVGFPFDGDHGDKILLCLVQQGQHPLYEVNARIVDLDKTKAFEQKGRNFFESLNKSQTVLNIGNMSSGSAQMIGELDLSGRNSLRLNVFISARNGFYNELVRMKKINGKWTGALKVTRDNEVLIEKVGKGFPTVDGLINWE